jgi:hypothetical protein
VIIDCASTGLKAHLPLSGRIADPLGRNAIASPCKQGIWGFRSLPFIAEALLRILLLSPFLPDTAAPHGGGLYLGSLCEGLAQHAELGLAWLRRNEDPAKVAAGPWAWQASVPYAGTGGSLAHKARMLWHWGVCGRPLVVAKHWHRGVGALVQRARAEFAPDVAMVELAQMAQYLPLLRDLPTLFTDHEAGAPVRPVTDLGSWADRWDARFWRQHVRRNYPLATQVQALTFEDAGTIRAATGVDVRRRMPLVPVPAVPVRPAEAPPRALFLGDYDHHPNPEAARVLVREVLPLVRAELPEAELWLAGSNQHRILDLEGAPGVKLVGLVPDLHWLLSQARLMLGPLWSGGGFRMKGIASLAHGLPVVTNRLGAQGVDAPESCRTVVESPAELATATLRWLRDPAAAAAAGAAAHAWASTAVSADAVARQQVELLHELVARTRARS